MAMKLYKKLDLYTQMMLLVAWVPFLIVGRENHSFEYFYFIVGGWQILSCVVHFIFSDFYPYSSRKIYLWVLLLVIFLGIGCLLEPRSLLVYLFALLFFSPIMAVWYCFICYKEVKLYRQKEWIQLK
jgi:hypothetical protein